MIKKFLIISGIIVILLLAIFILYKFCYSEALITASNFTLPVKEYYELDESGLKFTTFPEDEKLYLAFEFKYWNPGAWDLHFYVYVSPFGNLLGTNPRDLAERIERISSGDESYINNLKKLSDFK